MHNQVGESGGVELARGARSKSDVVLYVLAVCLLVTIGLAAMYGFKYGNVDSSVVPGDLELASRRGVMLKVSIADDLSAKVSYLDCEMSGKFELAGAEKDSILYQLRNVDFADGADASDAVFFLRMPRSGLQGDFVGTWMTYFSWPSQGLQHSDWVITDANGTASVGSLDGFNAIVAQRSELISQSSERSWTKSGNRLLLSVSVAKG